MDSKRFDALSRSLATSDTRRSILRLLSALPLPGALLTFGGAAEGARRHHKSRRHHANQHQRHRPDRHQRVQDQKKSRRKQKRKRQCTPESAAQTCAGECNKVTNNCGAVIDCGSCDCDACSPCQICNATIGRCLPNPTFLGQDCGSPGQVCLANGTCACDDTSCPAGQRCNGIVCVCDAISCPDGCCDSTRTCRIDDGAACGTAGGVCVRCTGECVDGACECASGCPDCQSCNPATGRCVPIANGTACDDGDACTRTDTCQGGVCVGSNPVTCTALDQCHAVGVCNPATGTCSNPNKPNDTACNDGNACTQTDTCQGGVCTGSNPVVCAAEACENPGVCNPADGICSPPTPKPEGAACSGGLCCGGVCQECCDDNDCPTPACQRCDGGLCVAINQGEICGTSTHVGTNLRCCDGDCPDPNCKTVGADCEPSACNSQCCTKQHDVTFGGVHGFCVINADGGPCGSDRDCQGTTPHCVCGTCTA